MEHLGELVGTTKSNVNKWEKGVNQIKITWLEKLSEVFNVPIQDIIDTPGNSLSSFEEDAEPYTPEQAEEPQLSETEFLYTAKTGVLDQIGIVPGTTIILDMAPDALKNLLSEDIVIAQIYEGMSARTVLRQFIAPSLLITNSLTDNQPIINLRMHDVTIKGVVTSWHSHLRSPRQTKMLPPK